MKKIILSSLLAVAAAPAVSQAADGTITFNGTITAQTCTINGGTPSFAVNMPRVPTTALAAAGQTAGVVNDSIRITLTGCSQNGASPAANGAVRAFFEGGPTVDATTRRLRNSTGTATNVQVGLINQDGTDVAVGAASQNTQYVPLAGAAGSGAATLVYGSKYVATGAATAGTVITSVQYSLDFQ
ncbi:fimbrial protein [Herbaspirillum lusitanum]|uniref:fimbrial protein n=1 Tax=Herbaspirillum lusitanum TaxID=213312 RepID=UPI0002E9DCF3|nr:fimbrial protein [Herbaspirillum lusitanum]